MKNLETKVLGFAPFYEPIADLRGIERLDVRDPLPQSCQAVVDARGVVESALRYLRFKILQQRPDLSAEIGVTSSDSWTFVYCTFGKPSCDDPLVVGVHFEKLVDNRLRMRCDVSHEHSGRIVWERPCEFVTFAEALPGGLKQPVQPPCDPLRAILSNYDPASDWRTTLALFDAPFVLRDNKEAVMWAVWRLVTPLVGSPNDKPLTGPVADLILRM